MFKRFSATAVVCLAIAWPVHAQDNVIEGDTEMGSSVTEDTTPSYGAEPNVAVLAASKFICTQSNLRRTVEVVYDYPAQAVPCSVVYHKPTEEPESDLKTLWTAQNEAGYCEKKTAELIDMLEANGWSCSPADEQSSTTAQ